MKYMDEFRDNSIARRISKVIFSESRGAKPINIMEVCGTHTMSICKFGIRNMLPENINLISGPGCPVCVTPKVYIDNAINFSRLPDTIIATFGDMMRVPGSSSSLLEERSTRSIKVLYSPLDAVEEAQKNPDKKVIFLGVGFETTSPTIAASLIYARDKKINNFFVYSGHKIIPPAMRVLVEDPEVKISAFLCPAHVSTILGTESYKVIAKKYAIPCVVTGFEPLDVLQGILMIVQQIKSKKIKVENQYNRVVRESGNKKARDLVNRVFSLEDSEWRGIGSLPKSGLEIRKRYASSDALENFPVSDKKVKPDVGCICGNVLKGIKRPTDCKLFSKKCTPEKPQGACMVSSEGTCAAYYRYNR